MKNFISMFLMTSLLLGGMTFTIGKMSVCAASKNRIETAQQKQAHLFGSAKNKLAATDPDFAAALREAAGNGVYVLAMDCAVTEQSMTIRRPVEVRL